MVNMLFRTGGFWKGRDVYRAVSLGFSSFIRRTGQSISTENHYKTCKSRVHSWINLVSYYEYNYTCIWYLYFICDWRWMVTWIFDLRASWIQEIFWKASLNKICLKWCFHFSIKRSLRELRGQPLPPPLNKFFFLITSRTVKNFWTVVKH